MKPWLSKLYARFATKSKNLGVLILYHANLWRYVINISNLKRKCSKQIRYFIISMVVSDLRVDLSNTGKRNRLSLSGILKLLPSLLVFLTSLTFILRYCKR